MENADGKESPRAAARRVAMALTAQLASRNTEVARVVDSAQMPNSPARAYVHDEHGAAPAQATAYVSMLPYAYTNSDVAQLFSQFGKLARVTILRDKQTRKSRGVAFIQFARAEDCARAVDEMHDTELEGFRLACSVSRDNGRSQEFVRKRKYTAEIAASGGVSRCFECGEYGHFSYNCPRNVLGARERPSQKKKLKNKKKRFDVNERVHYFNDEGVVNLLAPPADGEHDLSLSLLAYPSNGTSFDPVEHGETKPQSQRKRKALGNYFSDESASDEDDGDGKAKR